MTEIDRERYEALFDALNPYDDVEREVREAGRELLNALEATDTRANVAEEMASIAEDYKAARDTARARLAEVEGERDAAITERDAARAGLSLARAMAGRLAALTEKGTDR